MVISLASCPVVVFFYNVFLLLAKIVLLGGPSIQRLFLHVLVGLVCLVVLALFVPVFKNTLVVDETFSHWRVHIFSNDLLSLSERPRLSLKVI